MVSNKSFLQKLENQLEEIYPIIDTLMDNSEIYYHDTNGRSGNVISLGSPVNHYRKKDEKSQLIAREKFVKFLDNIELLLQRANPNTVKRTKESEKRLIKFIEQDRYGVPASTEGGKLFFRKQSEAFRQLIELFKKDSHEQIIVPDTNALVQFPDPTAYRKLFASPFTLLILPTVLSELDKLKINHRNEAFREKAKSAIKRLKGFRTQGDVLAGITIDKTITVKMIASEPDFQKTLKWLDPNNEDDRIIASALDLQVQHPADSVVLVTSDINLQNKAQAAMLTFADTDDME
jgi:rRNA-processing protein FCF1